MQTDRSILDRGGMIDQTSVMLIDVWLPPDGRLNGKTYSDKRNDSLFDENAHVFAMEFSDGAIVELFIHSDFEDFEEVEHYSNLQRWLWGNVPNRMAYFDGLFSNPGQ